MPKYYRRRHHHYGHRRIRLKKRVFYAFLTTLFCVGIAALINVTTNNVYVYTIRFIIYILSGGILVLIFFFFMYMLIKGRRRSG